MRAYSAVSRPETFPQRSYSFGFRDGRHYCERTWWFAGVPYVLYSTESPHTRKALVRPTFRLVSFLERSFKRRDQLQTWSW